MTEHDQKPTQDDEAGEELEEQDGELLPRREVMSIVDLGAGESGPIASLPVEPRDPI
jgi:hypothetical protein